MSLATNLAQIPNITTNYIPRATATGFVNGVVYDDGTNVTIGGTTGGYKLNVLGTLNATGALSGTSATFSGNVGIGNTASSPLDVTANNSTAIHLRLRGRAADSVGQMEFWNNAQSIRYGYISTDSTSMSMVTTQAIPLVLGTNSTERLRITSGGNVGIGTSSPSRKLSIESSDIWMSIKVTGNREYLIGQGTSDALRFFDASADAERMRITSGGNVGIGNTGYSNIRFAARGADTSSSNWAMWAEDSNGTTILAARNDGAVFTGSIGTSTGTALVLTSGGYIVKSSSSIRYKKDVQPIDIGLDFILSLNPVSYNLKNGDIPQVGFIAEDFPEDRLVSNSMIDPMDELKGYQKEGVNYAQIVAPLVKAVQEQQAQIEELKALIAAK